MTSEVADGHDREDLVTWHWLLEKREALIEFLEGQPEAPAVQTKSLLAPARRGNKVSIVFALWDE